MQKKDKKAERKDSDEDLQRLLKGALGSERFKLASGWFHCVKVEDDVLGADHPYHALFAGRHPAQLVLASRNGAKLVNFLGSTQQKVKWSGIVSVLRKSYRKDPTAAVKGIERLLSRFDALDSERKELRSQLERYSEKKQADKMKHFEKKLGENQTDREALLAKKAKFEDLGLRATKKTSVGG